MASQPAHKYDIGGKMIRKAALPTQEQLKSSYATSRSNASSSPLKKKAAQTDSVRVMVRVRPFSGSEIRSAEEQGTYMQSVINMPRQDQVLFLDHQHDYQVKHGFNFDNVFWSCTQEKNEQINFATQNEVYLVTGSPCLEAAWEGINSCVFAYGQTGSGKTHTMMGDPVQITEAECPEEAMGVIPRLCRALFADMEQWKEQSMKTGLTKQSEVEVRFLEIYNEKVRDLLHEARVEGCESMREHANSSSKAGSIDPDDLRVREHPVAGPYVHGTTVFKPRSYAQMIALVTAGNQARSIATTKMNDRSSRSHAMFRISLTQTTVLRQERVGIGGPKTITSVRRANMNLVDLAGSENVKRSGAAGATLVEAQKINLSLTTLRRVIDSLIDQKPGSVIPYRDSTLTWLLRQELGGNAKTYMLATVSPHHSNAFESLRTLEYAMRARSIVNTLQVNEDDTSKLLSDLEKRISETQKAMEDMEKGKASQEELELAKTDLEIAKGQKHAMEEKFSKALEEAEEVKLQLERAKERQVTQAFKSAVVLNLTRARLKSAFDEINAKQTEVAAAADSVQELRHEIADHRQLVEQLKQEKAMMKEKSLEMSRREADLSDSLQKEKEKSLSKDQQEEEMSARISALSQQMSDLLKEQQVEKQRMKEHHDRELGAILRESEDMAKSYQQQIQRFHIEREAEEGRLRAEIRAATQDADYKLRVYHRDMEELQTQHREAENGHSVTKQELAAKAGELEAERESHEQTIRNYEALLQKAESEKEGVHDTIKERNERIVEAMQDTATLRACLVGFERKEEAYAKMYEDVVALLEHIHAADGALPGDWTLDDVREAIKAFSAFKLRYVSNRPNKEKLRQMLRADPSRKGAERMREMLTENPLRSVSPERPLDEDFKVRVVLDGMRCPTLPPRNTSTRSVSPPTYRDAESNGATFGTEDRNIHIAPVLDIAGTPPTRSLRNAARRAPNTIRSTSPGARRSVSPVLGAQRVKIRTISPRVVRKAAPKKSSSRSLTATVRSPRC